MEDLGDINLKMEDDDGNVELSDDAENDTQVNKVEEMHVPENKAEKYSDNTNTICHMCF